MNTRMASKMLVTGTLQHLRLVAIDIDIDLRGRGLEGGEGIGDAGRAVGLGHELLRDARELVGGHALGVLQAHREARCRTHAAHRRRNEHQHLRVLDLRQPNADILGHLVDGLALADGAPRSRRAPGTAGRRWWRP